MSQPTPYTPNADFSQQEANNASGRSTVNTAALDAEFAAIEATLDQTLNNIQLIQRDDGKLGDVLVEVRCLAPDVLNVMGGFNLTGLWVTATAYAVNDIASSGEYTYVCKTAHTSGVSFDATNWVQFGFSAGADAAQAAAAAQVSAANALVSQASATASAASASASAASAGVSASSASASSSTASTYAGIASSGATAASNSASAAAASFAGTAEIIAASDVFTPAGTGASSRTYQNKMRDMVSVHDFGAVGDGVANDRLALIAALAYLKTIGGGTLNMGNGKIYLLSGVQQSVNVPEIQSNVQYSTSAYDAQIYVTSANNIKINFNGSKLLSNKTDGGIALCFDGCSNLVLDGLRMEGATVMSGATVVTTGNGGITFLSTVGHSKNNVINNAIIDKHYGSIDIAGNPAGSYVCENIAFTGNTVLSNSYYGLTCRGNGRNVTVESLSSYRQNRPFFIYDTQDVSIRATTDDQNGGYQSLVKSYTTNVFNIDIDLLVKNRSNTQARLEFQSQHNPAFQPVPAYLRGIKVRYSEINCAAGESIAFSYYRDAVLTASASSQLFSNFSFEGAAAGTLLSSVTQPIASPCVVDLDYFYPSNGRALLSTSGFVGAQRNTYLPSLTFGGAAVGMTYSTQNGEYFIQGGMCFVNGRITLSNKGSSTGAAMISLPINTREDTDINPVMVILANAGMVSLTGSVIGYAQVSDSGNVVLLMQGASGSTNVTNANLSNTSDIQFSFAYPV